MSCILKFVLCPFLFMCLSVGDAFHLGPNGEKFGNIKFQKLVMHVFPPTQSTTASYSGTPIATHMQLALVCMWVSATAFIVPTAYVLIASQFRCDHGMLHQLLWLHVPELLVRFIKTCLIQECLLYCCTM